MATVTYTNFLPTNPRLSAVLHDDGIIGTNDATTFEIINADGGDTDGFIFRLTGTGFTYAGTDPTGGTITGVTILDGSSNVLASIAGTFGTSDLGDFWDDLQTSNGVSLALHRLLDLEDTVVGSDGSDFLDAFGETFDFLTGQSLPDHLSGGAGDDALLNNTFAGNVLVGGTGDDVFVVGAPPPGGDPDVFPNFVAPDLEVHGSAEDGSGGAGETDTLFVTGFIYGFSAITNIDVLHFEDFAEVVGVVFATDQIGPGLVPNNLAVEGRGPNEIVVRRGGTAPVDLDLSGWSFSSWGAADQITRVDLVDALGPTDDHVLGTVERDVILGGAGNDTLDGGEGIDTLDGGLDNDVLISSLAAAAGGTLDGGDDIDTAMIDRSGRTGSFTLDIGDPLTPSNLGDGTMVVNVERVEFRAGSGNDDLTGGAFTDLLIGNAGADFLAGNGGDDTLDGGSGADRLNGDAGNDTLSGGDGNDSLDGGEGDDTMRGGAGIDTHDGGGGIDSAVFAGLRAAYTITSIGSDFQISGPDGLDFLTNVEFAAFDDRTILLPPLETFTGTPRDDNFVAPSGNSHIDGLGGNDTITFGFRLIDATISWSDNAVIVDTVSSHTELTGFETFVFTDGTVNNNDSDPLVDDLFYYSRYHDVWDAHEEADQHYHRCGWGEGRDPNALFDTAGYLASYSDVAAAGVNPLTHYDTFGRHEGRDPSLGFDTGAYLAAYADVAAAGVNPLGHFLQFGVHEGRSPFADGVWG